MKKVFALLIMASFMFYSSGCEFKKTAAKVVANGTAPVISTILSCKNTTAVKEDMLKKLEEWFKVNETQTKTMAVRGVMSPICVAAVSAILPLLVDFATKKLPEKWECNAELLGGSAYDLAVAACGTLKDGDIKSLMKD